MGNYTSDNKRHMSRLMTKERHIVYYKETPVPECWDPYSGEYTAYIYTYITETRFLWKTFRDINQSVPYIDYPNMDGEIKTNIKLRSVARKEYYDAIIFMNEHKNPKTPENESEKNRN